MTECYETKVGSHSVKCKKYKHQVQLIFRTDDAIQVPNYLLPTYVGR
jgi:hypothetical protein